MPDAIAVTHGRLSVVPDRLGIHVLWDGVHVTGGVGLNTAVCAHGVWLDSSKAGWHTVEAGG
ncbi:MAG: hypothetical protein ABH885_00220, partial [Candidatus Omnitrophota bacterium]